MGIIAKQSITGTIYSYIGAAIGFVTSALILPRLFSTTEVGLLSSLISYASLMGVFATLGFNTVTQRMFSYFRNNETNNNGYLRIVLQVALLGFVILALGFLIAKPFLIAKNIDKSPLLVSYLNYLLPLTFFLMLFGVLDTYNTVLYNSVRGTFYKEFVQRVLVLMAILIFYILSISFHQFVWLYMIAFCLPTLFLAYLIKQDGLFSITHHAGFVTAEMRKSMMSVAFFGFISSISAMLVLYLANIMLNSMVGLDANGIYSITFLLGSIILIPSRSLIKISTAIISDAWKNNDLKMIDTVYMKSTLTQLIIGSFLFVVIWVNIDNILFVLPAEYAQGKYVIFFIALANLVNVATGVNVNIIMMSKHYKIITYFMLLSILLTVGANYIFIKQLGVVGAAIAFLISGLFLNLLYYLFLLIKYNMQPFNYKHIVAIAIAAVAFIIAFVIPYAYNFIIDSLVRSGIVVVVFAIFIYWLNVSEDITSSMNTAFAKIKSVIK